MSLRIRCPFCGDRDAEEFVFGGEMRAVPSQTASADEHYEFAWIATNATGDQPERWYHVAGCRRWVTLTRNTTTNAMSEQ